MRSFFAPLALASFVALAKAGETCAKFKYGIGSAVPITVGGTNLHQCMVPPILSRFVVGSDMFLQGRFTTPLAMFSKPGITKPTAMITLP